MKCQSFTSSQKNFAVCAGTPETIYAFRGTDESVVRTHDALTVQSFVENLAGYGIYPVICNQFELFTFVPDYLLFETLKNKWYLEREGVSSSIDDAAMCPSYQQIIGMGDKAVPLILKSIQKEGNEPDMWFWALRFITGVDPLEEEDRGDINAMAERWLQWAVGKYAW